MHIAEGVLSPPILLAGAALAALGTARGLRALENERLMGAAVLSSAFFVASLIHVPVGPGVSAHLLLNGLVGLMLGWAAFPALLVALLLQGVLFQFGGITTLGVNTFTMALPAALCPLLFGPLLRRPGRPRLAGAFCCGAFGIAGSALLTALALAATNEGFATAAGVLLAAHAPIMVVEGVICAFAVSFLSRVRPEMLPFCAEAA